MKASTRFAIIGSGVAVATAGVITLLVIKPSAKDEETETLASRSAAVPALAKRDLEGGVVKPWDAKGPSAEELRQAAEAAKAEQEEGEKEAAKAQAALDAAATPDPQLARQQAIEQARSAGILGITTRQQGGAFASLTGTGDISSGFDDDNIYGGLIGSDIDAKNGGFGGGLGTRGSGPGGGGTGWGTIGTGRYGTIGRGSGTGRGGMRGAAPTVSIGQPNAQGDLDKAIIRRYIKRNIQKIQYCYEKELAAKPALEGRVTVRFEISPNGSVASSSASGIDPSVSSCIADTIKGIEFPKPKGGGGVIVNYPFSFRPAGTP